MYDKQNFLNFLFSLIPSIVLIGQYSVSAEEIRAVTSPTTPITDSLGGRKLGELYLATPVRVLESKGDWVKVSTEGWVKVRDLSGARMDNSESGQTKSGIGQSSVAKAAAGEALNTVTQDVLSVQDFITAKRTDIDPPRLYLTITVKNISTKVINQWSGTLVVQDTSGKVLFREPISQEKAQVAAKGTTDVTVYWEPHEEPYGVLQNLDKSMFKLSLAKVTTSE